jgi:ABC-2 type transport system ATP-binding protein
MQRRLNLAAGLLHEPAILLLDEPTAGIDVQSRARIFETVRGLRDAGTTILYTTHHMEDARRLCDRITLMDGGRIVLEGEPERIVRDRGRFTLRMALDRVTDELVSEVAALDEVCDVRPGPGRLSISLVHRGDGLRAVSRIGEIALAHGIELTLEGTVETDLEAVFLDLTGHGLRDRHGGPA